MDKQVGALILGLICAGCSSSHKLTGTDYVNIETESAPAVTENYPTAVIEAAGWNDITTELKEKDGHEEVRIWLSSSVYPGHLYKLTKGRKNVEGDAILYWEKESSPNSTDFIHQKMIRYLDGICTEFLQVQGYGYCFPKFVDGLNWEARYNSIENQNFWQITGGSENVNKDKQWQVNVQMRLGNYYRDFTHQNPEEYDDAALQNNVLRFSNAVKLISNRFQQNTSKNSFEGITDGTSFTLCDSSETWEFSGILNKLLADAGMKATVNTEEKESLYYVMVQGRVTVVWYNEWATGDFDRKLNPKEIYRIKAVTENKCPEEMTFK